MLAGDPFNKKPIANRAAEFICQVRSDFKKSLVSTTAGAEMRLLIHLLQGLDSFNFPRDCPWGLKTAFHFPSW